jgi:peptide/nickel transport system substrate-binding protein
VGDPFARLDGLLDGRLHIADIPIAAEPFVEDDPRIVVATNPAGGFGYSSIILTLDRPPFDNRALRQAVQLAIDRDALNDFWYGGGRAVAHGPIPPVFAWAVDPGYQPYRYDPRLALDKLREGGRPDGFEFELWAAAGEVPLYELIQEQLAEVGIRITIRLAPFPTVVERMQQRASNAYFVGFSTGLDPDGAVTRFLPDSAFNDGPYDNPAVTDLVLRARRTVDLDERGRIYKEVAPLIMEDSPLILLFTSLDRFTGSSRVHGWYLGVRATAGYAEFWLAP